MKTRLAPLLALFLTFSFFGNALGQVSPNLTDNQLIVSPNGPYTTIESALNDARDGDVIEVRGGVYRTSLVVKKSVTLEGVGNPVIDGGGVGTVVMLSAPQIVLRGFEIRHSGNEPDFDHSGIIINASGVTVENNRIYEVLFGIFIEKADNVIVRNNDITSKVKYDLGRKGDSIRVWYSQNALIEKNHLHESRDVVIWYSKNIIVRDNIIETGRFAVHLMYSNSARVERNVIHNNSVGIYTMYSNDVILRGNDIRGQRGPSGYALGFKDASNVDASDNIMVDNRGGVFLDNTPFNPGTRADFRGNIFAFNDIGVIMLTAVKGNTFENNTFWENIEQVSLQGSGLMGKNTWQKNYWSDYAGFDANGDGMGDVPYRSEHFFENLTDRAPMLRALIYSPASQTIEFAASSFPIFKPQPKFVDESPAMQPAAIPKSASPKKTRTIEMIIIGFVLLTSGIVCGWLGWREEKFL
ncbi:MAG: nitrous oxide reductase family maturation protein NosD [Chloroflexota bacterium]|mgnify:FL=1